MPKIPCPYSKEKLHELYWIKGMGMQNIAYLASEVCGRKITDERVRKWLVEFDIAIRKREQCQLLATNAASSNKSVSFINFKCDFCGIDYRIKKGAANGEKADTYKNRFCSRECKGKFQKQQTYERHEKRNCVFCGVEIHRTEEKFRRPPELTFCSTSCANKYRYKDIVPKKYIHVGFDQAEYDFVLKLADEQNIKPLIVVKNIVNKYMEENNGKNKLSLS